VIQPPRRSVTRFFIPLIDVLILLFCIFLLMPYVKPVEGEAGEGTGRAAEPPPPSPGELADLRRQVEQLRADRERLARERRDVVEQLKVRVLEIDPASGRLYYYAPERVEVATQADAQALIDEERRKAGGREVFFLVLFPREPSGYPLQRQIESYDKWFRDVPHGFDSPFGRP
jgi:hypothetical protein